VLRKKNAVSTPLMSGGNLYDLQKNLGHHSAAFTAEIYGHLSKDHRVREAARVSYPAPTAAPITVGTTG
jgi:integrase